MLYSDLIHAFKVNLIFKKSQVVEIQIWHAYKYE